VPRSGAENIIPITNIIKQYLLQPVNYVVIYSPYSEAPRVGAGAIERAEESIRDFANGYGIE
jgi:hypothetical protein